MPLGVVNETVPTLFDCPVLDRLLAYEVDQGTSPTLEHIFRDAQGNPVDLSSFLADSDSQSLSDSLSDSAYGSAVLRVREYTGRGLDGCVDKIWEYPVTSPDPENGVLRADLTADGVAQGDVTDEAGAYEAQWAIRDSNDKVVAISRSILSVERSLFAPIAPQLIGNLGPPTIREIRMSMRDAVATNLLLDGHEFGAEEILRAIVRPIQQWNETPPLVPPRYTTRTFPYREYWLKSINADLYFTAAAFYRRNKQQFSGSGLSNTDMDREREYMNVATLLKNEWDTFLVHTKINSNSKRFFGWV